jgi:hypothetical protein
MICLNYYQQTQYPDFSPYLFCYHIFKLQKYQIMNYELKIIAQPIFVDFLKGDFACPVDGIDKPDVTVEKIFCHNKL